MIDNNSPTKFIVYEKILEFSKMKGGANEKSVCSGTGIIN